MICLLKNGYIVDSVNNFEGERDILIKNGVIIPLDSDKSIPDKVIDCAGLTVIPGICDMHVHLRDPGQTHKEDIFTGADAAAAGGVTAVMCMPNTTPVIDSPEKIRDIIERSKTAKVKIYPCASITKGLAGEELTDFAALKQAGAVAVSDDGRPVGNARLMAQAMILAEKVGLPIISHCEDFSLAEEYSRISENVVTTREICLANDLKVPIHIAHVSTKEAVESIRIAKGKGLKVTCETAPHHFSLTDKELTRRDADYKMNPPLRTIDDVLAINAELCGGTFDCIASDHAPHSADEKSDFDNAPNGVVGLETILAVTLTRLVHMEQVHEQPFFSEWIEKVPLMKVVEMLCVNPRRILGIPGGSLDAGSPADITVFDLNERWTVEAEKLHSKSKNSCFKGMSLKGRVKYTLVNGEVVYNGV